MLKRIITIALAFVMCLGVAMPAWAAEASLDFADYKDSINFPELEAAYREYSQKAGEMGKFVEISLEEFVCGYDAEQYSNVEQYLDISEQSLSSCQSIATVEKEAARMRLEALQNAAMDNGGIEPYSSSGKWYYNCYDLIRDGVYGKYDLLGDQVTTGDIVMDEKGLFGLTGHTALVEGHYYSNIFQTYYVRVVEAISDGVCYGILSDDRVDERDSYVYRVSTTTAKCRAAINFARSQVGKAYKISGNYKENVRADRETWYCSLLCYAAYYNNGVDIGDKGNVPILAPKQLIRSSKLSQTDIGH